VSQARKRLVDMGLCSENVAKRLGRKDAEEILAQHQGEQERAAEDRPLPPGPAPEAALGGAGRDAAGGAAEGEAGAGERGGGVVEGRGEQAAARPHAPAAALSPARPGGVAAAAASEPPMTRAEMQLEIERAVGGLFEGQRQAGDDGVRIIQRGLVEERLRDSRKHFPEINPRILEGSFRQGLTPDRAACLANYNGLAAVGSDIMELVAKTEQGDAKEQEIAAILTRVMENIKGIAAQNSVRAFDVNGYQVAELMASGTQQLIHSDPALQKAYNMALKTLKRKAPEAEGLPATGQARAAGSGGGGDGRRAGGPRCWLCGELGHRRPECRFRMAGGAASGTGGGGRTGGGATAGGVAAGGGGAGGGRQ
jgi:hypothetical protein